MVFQQKGYAYLIHTEVPVRVPFRAPLILISSVLCSSACVFGQVDPPTSIPGTITICDKVQQFEACADWKWNGKDFDYNYGKVQGTGMITRNGPSEVILRRTDSHASWPLKRGEVEYYGTFDTNHSGHGSSKYIVNGQPPFVGTWTASFAPMKAVETHLEEPTLGPPPPTGTQQLAVPVGLEECEGDCTNSHQKNVGAWYFRGMKGEANWTQGNKAKLIVDRYDMNGIVIRREDLTTSSTAGQTGIYTGKLSDGRIDGVATLKWLGPDSQPKTKQIPWYATIPDTTCEPSISADEAMQVGGQAAAFRQMSAAFQCFLVAANQGAGRAKTLVGLMYRDGIGITVNYDQANRWLKTAAIQGDFNAQLALEQMYELGVGANADSVQAAKWKHAADTNPAMLAQAQSHREAREDQQLMFMGLTSILSAALGPRAYLVY